MRNNKLVLTVIQDQTTNTLTSALYIVAMPIGNWEDLSNRALNVLAHVNVILAEDTRVSGQILKGYGLDTRLISLNAHSEVGKTPKVIEALEQGQSLALISDAGTPAISDPGRHLIETVAAGGYPVIPIPGPSALIAALSISGLQASPSHFFGFLSSKSGARDRELDNALSYQGTLIFYEAPHRIVDLAVRIDKKALGRKIVFARELTKLFEQVIRLEAGQCQAWFESNPDRIRGEFVVLIGVSRDKVLSHDIDAERLLRILARELPPSKVASIASEITGIPRRMLYDQLTNLS